MISAEQARRISTTSFATKVVNLTAQIEEQIKQAAPDCMGTRCDMTSWDYDVVMAVKEDLEALGYKVKHDQGSDQRDGGCWNNLVIDWRGN